MITAWVLVFGIGLPSEMAISGIADRESCINLREQLQKRSFEISGGPNWLRPEKKWACYEYPAIISTGKGDRLK